MSRNLMPVAGVTRRDAVLTELRSLSTDIAVRHDGERNRRLHRELVHAILDNRQRGITTAVRNHIQSSAAELLEILREREQQSS